MNLKKGAVLKHGSYVIESVLGQGGFGITYLALQTGLNRKVAIKEFFMKEHCERVADGTSVSLGTSGSRDVVLRFKGKFIREAQMIASMRHSNIVNIHDVFEENNTAYYVMDYHEGGTLSSKDLPLSSGKAIFYARQICSALSYLHSLKIMHLDVKPSNILIDDQGNAVLIDFGVSKRYDASGPRSTSTPVGISHGYAPIEQYSQESLVFSPATDIYALGATMYKLLTGQTPPDASVLVGNPSRLTFPQSVPEFVASAIRQCMKAIPDERPQSADAFAAMLEFVPIVETPPIVPSTPEPPSYPSAPKPRTTTDDETDLRQRSGTVRYAVRRPSSAPLVPPPPKENKATKWILLTIFFLGLAGTAAFFLWPKGETSLNMFGNPTSVSEVLGGHEYVDLGLPSGVKWATCNYGASNPGDTGTYCQWAAVAKNNFFEDNGWTRGWRMPGAEDLQELVSLCTWKWTTMRGQAGYKVTGPNGSSIFLPASGYSGIDKGKTGYYWSTVKEGDNAVALEFTKSNKKVGLYDARAKVSVRPVLDRT